jgi:putative DNA primase/helicase
MNDIANGQDPFDRLRQGRRKGSGVPPPPTGQPPPGGSALELGDADLAKAFKGGDDFIYLPVAKEWRRWDGMRWRDSYAVEVEIEVRKFLDADIRPRTKKTKDRMRIAAHATVRAIEGTLRAMRFVDDRRFDRSRALLNTPAGTIDLSNPLASPRPFNRDDLITKLTAAAPSGDCPIWLNHIEFVTGKDADLMRYLQKLAGYALGGDRSEQIFAFLYGAGNNGKSVFLETLRFVMGDYAVTVDTDVFMERKYGTPHKEELMPMRGARLVVASELPPGAEWNEARIKNFTGGERTRARAMHANSTEFDIEALLIMAGNDKPHMKGVGPAMVRRLHLMPFPYQVGPDMRDKQLPAKLRPEAPGVIRWMIQGYRLWKSEGLNPPEVIEAATQEYAKDEDPHAQWLDDMLVRDPLQRDASMGKLFESWEEWCKGNGGLNPGKPNYLSRCLKRMGFGSRKSGPIKYILGLRFKTPDELDPST